MLPVQATTQPAIAEADAAKPIAAIACDGRLESLRADIRQDDVLPDRDAQLAGAEFVGQVRQGEHLLVTHPADRDRDADRGEPGLRLRVHAEVAVLVHRRPCAARLGSDATQRKRQFRLDKLEEFRDAEPLEQVAQARLLAIGAVTVLGEDTQHRGGHRHALLRRSARRRNRRRSAGAP